MSKCRNILASIAATCCLAANAGYFGAGTNRNATGVTYGTNAVTAIYSGSNLVWSSYIPWPNLVSRWKFDGNATDSASGFNGTWSGVEAYTNGHRGQAALFSGGSYVDIGTVAELNAAISGYFTISFWACIKGDGSYIFGKASALDSRLVAFGIWSPSTIGVADEGRYVIAEAPATTNAWEHWAWVFDGSATPSHTLYKNGNPAATSSFTFGGPYAGQLQISSSAKGKGVDGAIDDMMVFNAALSSNNVNRVMQGLPPN